jgi:nitroreductase
VLEDWQSICYYYGFVAKKLQELLPMIELLRKRRSIRSYTHQPVDPESVRILVEALLRAPTSRNQKPWSFVVVDDRELLGRLSTAKEHGSAFLKGAALGIVICGDPRMSDVWVEDCSIAAILVQGVAQSLGLGSCWIQIRERAHDGSRSAEQFVREQLGIPEAVKVECMVAIGHPAVTREPLSARELDYHKVKFNRYDNAMSDEQ